MLLAAHEAVPPGTTAGEPSLYQSPPLAALQMSPNVHVHFFPLKDVGLCLSGSCHSRDSGCGSTAGGGICSRSPRGGAGSSAQVEWTRRGYPAVSYPGLMSHAFTG